MSELSPADARRIAAMVAEELRQSHHCRFPEAQAKNLHQAAETLTREDIIVLAWLVKSLRATGDSAGRLVARLVVVGGLVAISIAVFAIGFAVHRGWIQLP